MVVYFYSDFVKKLNSTKEPSVTGTALDVVLKSPTSYENPTFILSGNVSTLLGYNYCRWGARYYYINNAIIRNKEMVEVNCTLDVLATYRVAILSSDALIDRCASGYDPKLADPMMSTHIVPYSKQAIYNIWGQQAPLNNWGYVSCVAISTDQSNYTPGTAHYIFDPRNSIDGEHGGLTGLTNALMNDTTLIEKLKGSLSNVQSAIIKMTYIPFKNFDDFDLSLVPCTLGTTLMNGNYKVYAKKLPQTGSALGGQPVLESKLFKFDISSLLEYSTLTDWRNGSPYTKAQLYLPFYGVINLNVDEYLDDRNISVTISGQTYTPHDVIIRANFDYVTGDIEYVRFKVTDGQTNQLTVCDRYQTSCGVNIPVSQIIGSPEKFVNVLTNVMTGTAGGAVTGFTVGGGAGAAIGAGLGAVQAIGQSALSGWMVSQERNLTTAGSFGSSSAVMWKAEPIYAALNVYGFKTTDEPSAIAPVHGQPLQQVDMIGSHQGYVKCTNASIEIAGHDQDKAAVNQYLNNGIFVE